MLGSFLRRRKRKPFIERTHKNSPGYSFPSVDDLRFQVLQFEKLIKNYIESKGGRQSSKNLHNLIKDELPKYPLYPQFYGHWPKFLAEVKVLKEYRNNIVHTDFKKQIPPVKELYDRFKQVNETLLPFRICSARSDKFQPVAWHGNKLEILVNDNRYLLSPADLNNLMIELHPTSRGKFHFVKGRVVEGKVLDYSYEKVTYFIEDFPEFELTHDESMTLEDILSSLIGRYAYAAE